MRRTASICAVMAILVTACTSQTNSPETTVPVEPTVTVDEAEWLPHSNGPPGTSMAALVEGVLQIDAEDRCVTIHPSESDRTYVVVWVDGTTLDVTDPSSPVLVLPSGERLQDGESISLAGGSWGADPNFDDSPDPAYRGVEIPPTCQADGIWIAAPER